jgi:tRNA threonylcarbamoyl adenosine modification protein YeaZ
MKILALEFSSPQRSVAVLASSNETAAAGSTLDHYPRVAEAVETGSGSTEPLGMIESVLREAQLEREQIECLALGLGPGSYTGIRAAIALAQGWQLIRPVKLLGVSSADTIAAQAQADGLVAMVGVVIDAQRNEFYLATYELHSTGWRQRQPLRLASQEEVRACEQSGQLLIGPEVTKWFPAGRIVFPRAATLSRLASVRTDFVPGEKLEPIYLRETKFVKAAPARKLPG